MASGSSGPSSANQRSISDATGEQLTRQQIQSLRSEEWTEEREAELTELKAKLKAAHKSWSAEQELYHDRVGGQGPISLISSTALISGLYSMNIWRT